MRSATVALALVGGVDALSSATSGVNRYSVKWSTPPNNGEIDIHLNRPSPPTGPYAGNGDVSLIYSGNGTSYVKKHTKQTMDWQQWLYMSKNDIWISDKTDYYVHMSAGRVGILTTPPHAGTTVNGTVQVFPSNASVHSSLTDGAGDATVVTTTRVLENNAIVTTLVCTSKSGGACPTTLLLSDTDKNHFGVPQAAGGSPDNTLVWLQKSNLHNALNPAYLGSCDPHVPLQSVERRFTVGAGGDLRMANGSCLWPVSNDSIITSGDCTHPQVIDTLCVFVSLVPMCFKIMLC